MRRCGVSNKVAHIAYASATHCQRNPLGFFLLHYGLRIWGTKSMEKLLILCCLGFFNNG